MMEKNNTKCNNKDHKENVVVCYCKNCHIYMCNKCQNHHSNLFAEHEVFNLDKNINTLFNSICQEELHKEELEFYCKTHNKLCCAFCITKIKKKGKGQHSNCDVCEIEKVKEEKKKLLEKNMIILENLLNNIENSIKKIKLYFVKICKCKEELKLKVQKMFTKIRNDLNNREDELLIEIDKKANDMGISEEEIKKSEKFPNKINLILEKGKAITKEWNNEKKLVLLINDCLNIENDIKNINLESENILKYENDDNLKLIKFCPEEEENDFTEFLDKIKNFGKITEYKCPKIFCDSLILNNNKKYIDNLISWINSKNTIEAKLLYRKTKDGDSYDIFHKLCDNQGPTLIIIKSIEGFIIGGYTTLDWDNYSRWKKDDDTFLFSLTNNKKYNKTEKSKNSIFCGKCQGPWFPFIGFGSYGKNNMSQARFEPQSKYFKDYIEIIPNNGEERMFDVEDVEVYKISYF